MQKKSIWNSRKIEIKGKSAEKRTSGICRMLYRNSRAQGWNFGLRKIIEPIMIAVKSGTESACSESGTHSANSLILNMRPKGNMLANHFVLKAVIYKITGITSAPRIEIPKCESIIRVMEEGTVKTDLLVSYDIEGRSRRIFLLIHIRISGNILHVIMTDKLDSICNSPVFQHLTLLELLRSTRLRCGQTDMIMQDIRIMPCQFIAETDNTVPHSIAGFHENITISGKIFISDIRGKLIKICHKRSHCQVTVQTGGKFILRKKGSKTSGLNSDERCILPVILPDIIGKAEEDAGIIEINADSVNSIAVISVREEFSCRGFVGGIDFPVE